MENKNIFLIFGFLQAATLACVVFFVLQGLNVVGFDTQVMLSVLFPLFTLIVEYTIYSK